MKRVVENCAKTQSKERCRKLCDAQLRALIYSSGVVISGPGDSIRPTLNPIPPVSLADPVIPFGD